MCIYKALHCTQCHKRKKPQWANTLESIALSPALNPDTARTYSTRTYSTRNSRPLHCAQSSHCSCSHVQTGPGQPQIYRPSSIRTAWREQHKHPHLRQAKMRATIYSHECHIWVSTYHFRKSQRYGSYAVSKPSSILLSLQACPQRT